MTLHSVFNTILIRFELFFRRDRRDEISQLSQFLQFLNKILITYFWIFSFSENATKQIDFQVGVPP